MVLPKGHLRISFLSGGALTLDPDGTSVKARVYWPYESDPDERSRFVHNAVARLNPAPGALQEIRILMKRDGLTAWVNGRGIGGQGSSSLSTLPNARSPVRVWSEDGDIEIKSIVVTPVR